MPLETIKYFAILVKEFYALEPKSIEYQYSPFHIVAKSGDLPLFQFLLEKFGSRNLNPARKDGTTPLFLAAYLGHFEICKLIIQMVENKNPARNDGPTPLYVAAQNGHFEICQLILPEVENKNPAKNDGITPLHAAAYFGHLDVCKLISNELEIKNPVSITGDTPLHYAAKNGHVETFKFLANSIRVLGDLTLKNDQGDTPLSLAEENNMDIFNTPLIFKISN